MGNASAVGSGAVRWVGWRRGFELGWGGARGTALRLGGLRCAKHRLARVARGRHGGTGACQALGGRIVMAESPSLA